MDTELLKTFLEVQKTRHFGKAAEHLYLTQSAVSFRIRQLEQSLGVALFSRHRNNIQLTEAGELLLPHAQAVISALQAAKTQLQQQSSVPQRLTVAVEPGLQFLATELLQMLVVNVETAVHLQVNDATAALNRHADVILTTNTEGPADTAYLNQNWRTLQLAAVGPVDKVAQAEGRLDWAGKLPQLSKAPLAFCCSDPRLLRQWLLRSNGTAFLPQPFTQELCQSGLYQLLAMPEQQIQVQLWIAKDAPVQWQQSEES